MHSLQIESDDILLKYFADHPDLAVDSIQPTYRGGTNIITLGTKSGTPVVYKYFSNDVRFLNELVCYRHFVSTDFVPTLLDYQPRLLVMERLPGVELLHAAKMMRDADNMDGVCRLSMQVGTAFGRLSLLPLPDEYNGYSIIRDWRIFRWDAKLSNAIGWYVDTGRRIQQAIPVYHTALADKSLTLIESQLDKIDRQHKMIYHEDCANAMVDNGELAGIFDLELCRYGTEFMQLGAASRLCGKDGLDWRSLLRGYEKTTGQEFDGNDLLSILAMRFFWGWIRASRWGFWNGDPSEKDQLKAAIDDAPYYAPSMIDCPLREEHDVIAEWYGEALK